MNLLGRIIAGSILAVLFAFLLTGLFDYVYFRAVLGTFEQGLGEINWVNPHLGKAVIAAVSAVATLAFFRYESMSLSMISRPVCRIVVVSFALSATLHGILTFATWGNIFDSLGHSHLYYGIDDANQVLYFSPTKADPRNPPHHPQTGKPLIAVTPENVREVEIRRHATFSEVREPRDDMFFASGTGKAMLWYSEREDGLHFFAVPGFDPATARELAPVTTDVKKEYLAAKKARQDRADLEKREATQRAADAEQSRAATQQARIAVERERIGREEANRERTRAQEQKEAGERTRQQRTDENKRLAMQEQQRLQQERMADDAAKGNIKDASGQLAVNSAYVRNQSTQLVKFQLLTENGWESKSIRPNGTLFLMSNCSLKIRWWEGEKYRKSTLGAWHQTHYEFNGVNPEEMRRHAPVHDLTIESGGEYAFELGK